MDVTAGIFNLTVFFFLRRQKTQQPKQQVNPGQHTGGNGSAITDQHRGMWACHLTGKVSHCF